VNASIESYRDLQVWQKSLAVSIDLYRVTKSFPPDERIGLTSQLRRAGVSVPSNIAEGYGRGSAKEYLRFLKIARGSIFEIETQLLIAVKLEYCSSAQFEELSDKLKECGRILAGLIRSIKGRVQA